MDTRPPATSPVPRLESDPTDVHRVYLVEADGTRWRIYHCRMERGALRRCVSQRATSRVFVSSTGVKRLYRFRRPETRALTASIAAVQLQESEYLASAPFDAAGRSAR